MYGKHAWPTCRITPILHVRRSLFSYTRQFCMYTYGAGEFWTTLHEKHTTSTCTRTPIVHVRKTLFSYTHSDPNSSCTQNTFFVHALARQFCMYSIVPINQRARPTHLAGPQTLLSHFIEQVQPEHGTTAARAAREQLLAQPPHSHLLSEPGPVRIGGSLNHQQHQLLSTCLFLDNSP